MRVVTRYKTVDIIYSDCTSVQVKCKSIKDAITFSNKFQQALQLRERASSDKEYPEVLYDYLKNKGYIEFELYKIKSNLCRKANLVRELCPRWI